MQSNVKVLGRSIPLAGIVVVVLLAGSMGYAYSTFLLTLSGNSARIVLAQGLSLTRDGNQQGAISYGDLALGQTKIMNSYTLANTGDNRVTVTWVSGANDAYPYAVEAVQYSNGLPLEQGFTIEVGADVSIQFSLTIQPRSWFAGELPADNTVMNWDTSFQTS